MYHLGRDPGHRLLLVGPGPDTNKKAKDEEKNE
jgi:hypothetical protein